LISGKEARKHSRSSTSTTTATAASAAVATATASTTTVHGHLLELAGNVLLSFLENANEFACRLGVLSSEECVRSTGGTGTTSSSDLVDVVWDGKKGLRQSQILFEAT
jgi:hypothetical protein